jgi:hypothetical protein
VLRSSNCRRTKFEDRGVAFSEVRFDSGAVPATVKIERSKPGRLAQTPN